MRHLGNFALGVGVDILRGHVGSRDGAGVLAGVREARRAVMDGQKIGQHKEVLDGPGEADRAAPGSDDLLAEERALTARLEQVREARAARER